MNKSKGFILDGVYIIWLGVCNFVFNMKKQEIIQTLKTIFLSGSEKNILEENLVKNIQLFGNEIEIDLILPTPALHIKKKVEVDILKKIHENVHPKAKVKVNVQVEAKESPQIRGAKIPNVKNIIAVASGKGGVGKSTVTTNLAVTLQEMGFQVGVLDADIYGPSMPMMFDVSDARPISVKVGGKNKMKPIESYGIKLLSIGFFAVGDQAVVWRGPMASKALNQLIRDAEWGELDFLLVDLPPGTGDIHLSIVQQVPITGAIVVSTPQAVALSDARKGVAMFKMSAINVPVLGIIQNMSYLELENSSRQYIFGQDGAKHLATDLNVPFLGEVPILQKIRESCDVGYPAAFQQNSKGALAFKAITKEAITELIKRNKELPPSEATRITTMAGCSAVTQNQ